MKGVLVLVVVIAITLLLLVPLSLPSCEVAGLERDIMKTPTPAAAALGLHVVLQPPLAGRRQHEYYRALLATLHHPSVRCAHLLTESVRHQILLYEMVPPELHGKIRTFNIGKRINFSDAVRYANLYLRNTTTVLCNADVAIHGLHWDRLTTATLAGQFFGLTRHEQDGCAYECDCASKWNGCHDAFAFVPPLAGGDELLEQISFRMGGLWGSENRFMWEVQRFNPALRISNPCLTFRTLHWHCVGAGQYRPSQDRRIMNFWGRSIEPLPTRWRERNHSLYSAQ